MKKRIICAVIASAMIAAASMSAVVYADDTQVSAGETAAKLTRGVWAAYGEDKITDYYIFEDETHGHTAKPENGLGLPFSIEQAEDGSAVFHFASADNNTPAEIAYADEGVFNVTLTGGDGESVTYRFELLPDEDPDTFMKDASEALLTPGVYAAYISPEKNDVYDMLDTYFVFTSETGGYTNAPIMGIGIPFGVEQNGTNAVFHMAAADDNTPAAILPVGDGSFMLTLDYGEGRSTIYRLVKTENADTENFSGASSYYGLFETTDEGIQLYNANTEFKFLLDSPRADEVGLEINYAMPLLEGFDLDFIFTSADKSSATYNISYDGKIDNDTIFIDINDLLERAGVDGRNIVSFTVKNNGSGTVAKLGFLTERNNSAKINIISEETASGETAAEANEQNPATGADDIFAAGTLAAIAGLTVLASRKRK